MNNYKKQKIKIIVNDFLLMCCNLLFMFVTTIQLFIFSYIFFILKTKTELLLLLVVSNFVMFAMFSYSYFKYFEEENKK